MPIPSFGQQELEKLSAVLADCLSHRELGQIFAQLGIDERGGQPKWERIVLALSARQTRDQCGNVVGAFIQTVMNPVRYAGQAVQFSDHRIRLNEVLAFSGLQLGEDGKLSAASRARTLTEAQERADRLRSELVRRRVHPDVLRFCRPELLQQNYFHAVLEATKSVAQKIRDKTGLTGDGADIVDKACNVHTPLLAINSLRTDTEKSEQTGFANLLKGMFGTFRNVTGHAPKIVWSISEQDALDLLSLVSYLHRRLDDAVRVPGKP